jgi:hypothetical protein
VPDPSRFFEGWETLSLFDFLTGKPSPEKSAYRQLGFAGFPHDDKIVSQALGGRSGTNLAGLLSNTFSVLMIMLLVAFSVLSLSDSVCKL